MKRNGVVEYWSDGAMGDLNALGPNTPILHHSTAPSSSRSGSALILVLWIILLLAVLVGSFAYDMKIEGTVTAYARNRLKAQYLAQAGIEWTRTTLARDVPNTLDPSTGQLVLEDGDDPDMAVAAYNIARGVGVSKIEKELGEGKFTISVLPEEGRRNVNTLTDEEWDEILDQAGVPEEEWEKLRDAFYDWVDPDDTHRLNGAEKDDEFYVDRGYEPKNGPLDTVDELLLIKGFSESLLYGGPSPYNEKDPPLHGIAGLLTTWGDGKVNINSASREVLMTIPGIDAEAVDMLIEKRVGLDGQAGTVDDGFKTVEEAIALTGLDARYASRLTVTERKYLRVIAIGEVNEVKSGIWAIVQQSGKKMTPIFWREESML